MLATQSVTKTGHIQDSLSGLTYMQARYYDPIAGRFLSTDPIGYQDQLNLYAYVRNEPIGNYDPNGLCTGSRITNDDGTCKSTGGFTTDISGVAQGRGFSGQNIIPITQANEIGTAGNSSSTSQNTTSPVSENDDIREIQWEEVPSSNGTKIETDRSFDFRAGDTILVTMSGTLKLGLDPVELYVTSFPLRSPSDLEGSSIVQAYPNIPEYSGGIGMGSSFRRIFRSPSEYGNRWSINEVTPHATGNGRTVYLRVYVPKGETK